MNQPQSPAQAKETLPKIHEELKRSSKNLSRMLRHFEKQYREQKNTIAQSKNIK